MTYNVALIVLDTLREDHAQGLEALSKRGFIRYKNAIAPAPWTLPSHISMFTGLMPSAHCVFLTRDPCEGGLIELARKSRLVMHKRHYGVLGEFKKKGYKTYIITANPFITPYFGFNADEVYIANNSGIEKWSEESTHQYFEAKKPRQLILELIKRRAFRRLWKWMKSHFWLLIDPTHKGGNHILRLIRATKLESPYFLYVNIMEAHSPYVRSELWTDLTSRCYVETIVTGKCPKQCLYIQRSYQKHASKAVQLALKIVERLDDGNTLIIVTSDHGEGLCDPAFGHGYWLHESLVRVPLWVRHPVNKVPPQVGKYVSLSQIPEILLQALGSTQKVGSDTVVAESLDSGYTCFKAYPDMAEKIKPSYRYVVFT